MAAEVVKVGENRYRARGGRYFEDFEVGAIYEHRPGRTITETDNTWFTLLTNNTHPLHFDAEYAKHTEFGQRLVVSTLTLSVITGMSVADMSQKAIANLGWTDIMMPKPVFAGDTLYAESEVLEKRASKSRPGQGIVKFKTTGKNQRGDVVCSFYRTVLVMGRDNDLEAKAGY
jgi:itaconyl-CoA hydratase